MAVTTLPTMVPADTLTATSVLLCADSTTLVHPEIIGLTGVRLDKVCWLTLCASGVEARAMLARSAEYFREVWVVSADDIDGINLAAALVYDHPHLPIYLICEHPSGSLFSRAQSANITAALTLSTFNQRFETVAAQMTKASGEFPGADSASANIPMPGFAAIPMPVGRSLSATSDPLTQATPMGGRRDPNPLPPRQSQAPREADPDPFELDGQSSAVADDPALRLSIERLRSIALAPTSEGAPDDEAFDRDFANGADGPMTLAPEQTRSNRSTLADPFETGGESRSRAPSKGETRQTRPASPPIDATTVLPLPTAADPKREPIVETRSRRRGAGSRSTAHEPSVQPAYDQTAMRPRPRMKSSRPGSQNGFLISVLSGGGGAGKSTVSALAAARIARQGLNVALLDCDLQFGDMAAFFGERPTITVDRLLEEGVEAIGERPRDGLPCIIAAPGHVEQSEAVDIERLLELVLPKFDVVVANTGAGWGDVHAYLMENSARVLFVVDQRASSVRACLHGLDLCRRCGIASNSFLFVLNRCSKSAPFTSIDLSCALKGATVAELKEGGLEVEEMLGSGLAAELADSSNPAVESIGMMLGTLLPERLAALAEARSAEADSGRGGRRRKSSIFRRKRSGAEAAIES